MTDLDTAIRARLDHEYPADSDDAIRSVLDLCNESMSDENGRMGLLTAQDVRTAIARDLGVDA